VATLCLAAAPAVNAADEPPSADACAAWPGEPDPLPRAADVDPLRARWATLRVRELSQAALADERDAPARAHRLWRRVLCLDPGNAAAAAGLARSPLVATHHLSLLAQSSSEPSRGPWDDLDRPLGTTRRVPAGMGSVARTGSAAPGSGAEVDADAQPTAALAPPPDPVGALLEEVQEQLRMAHYEQALARAERGRSELPADTSPRRVAELEVLSATAALALDRKDEAAASLRRALAAQPMLTLDPMETPPKVRRAFDRVRAGAEP